MWTIQINSIPFSPYNIKSQQVTSRALFIVIQRKAQHSDDPLLSKHLADSGRRNLLQQEETSGKNRLLVAFLILLAAAVRYNILFPVCTSLLQDSSGGK